MRNILLMLLPVLLLTAGPFCGDKARAGDDPPPAARVIDKDPGGTNMRDAPGGKIIYTWPRDPEDDARFVLLHEQKGGWFRVTDRDDPTHSGWMHGSVLGLTAAATEDGPCTLMKNPRDDGQNVVTTHEDAVLVLLDIAGSGNDAWYKVGYTDPKGRKYEGWVPRQCGH